MATGQITLPPGFELDEQSGPNLPEGFELDAPGNKEPQWSDLPGNARGELKDMGRSVMENAPGAAKFIATHAGNPVIEQSKAGLESALDVARGKPPMETPVGKELSAIGGAAGSLLDSASEVVKNPKGAIIRHPVQHASELMALAGLAGDAVPKLAEGITEPIDKFAEVQKAKSFGLTKGMVKKLAPEGISDMREIGRTALDEGIGGPLTSNETALAQAEALRKMAGEDIGGTYKTLDDADVSTFDPLRAAQDLDAKGESVNGLENAANISGKYEKGVNDILDLGDKPMLREAATRKQAYGDLSYKHMSASESNAAMRDVYDSMNKELDQAVRDGYQKLGTPEKFDEFLEAKRKYGSSKAIQMALQDKEFRELSGTSSPSLYHSVADFAGKQVRPVLAHGADWLSKTIKATPDVFGQYAAPLVQALQRGAQSLAATHFLLQHNDPEYQSLIENLSNGGNK